MIDIFENLLEPVSASPQKRGKLCQTRVKPVSNMGQIRVKPCQKCVKRVSR